MKKILLSVAVLLPGLLARSQGADSLSRRGLELLVVPRVEVQYNSPSIAGEDIDPFNPDYSMLYTMFEGGITPNISFSMINQWFRAYDLKELYTDTGRSDCYNWLRTLTMDFNFGGWSFSIGKDYLHCCAWEYNFYDWDSPGGYLFSSAFNFLQCCHWGVQASYTLPSQNTTFSAEVTTSPFGKHPFTSGLYNFGLRWDGNYGWFSNIWSINAIQRGPKDYVWFACLGHQATAGNFVFGLDWYNKVGDYDEIFLDGNTFLGRVEWYPSSVVDCAVRGGLETVDGFDNYWFGGAYVNLYPVKGSRDLKINLAVSSDTLCKGLCANAGITYYFRIPR